MNSRVQVSLTQILTGFRVDESEVRSTLCMTGVF